MPKTPKTSVGEMIPGILLLLFILYRMWASAVNGITQNIDFQELRWDIIERETVQISERFLELQTEVVFVKQEHFGFKKNFVLDLDPLVPSTEENIEIIREILLESEYEEIRLNGKFTNKDGSFSIRGEKGRQYIIVFSSSKQNLYKIHIGLEYHPLEILKWTIQKYLFE